MLPVLQSGVKYDDSDVFLSVKGFVSRPPQHRLLAVTLIDTLPSHNYTFNEGLKEGYPNIYWREITTRDDSWNTNGQKILTLTHITITKLNTAVNSYN